jgi:DNA repair exonuclease SbcCD ATPase subunit
MIANLIGHDQKSFSQIINQSGANSLEFLTATDTARKKFLIDLWNLGIYSKALEVFKDAAKLESQQLDILNSNRLTIDKWLAKLSKEDFVPMKLMAEVPAFTGDVEYVQVCNDLRDLEAINKERNNNAQYKRVLDSLVVPNCSIETMSIKDSDLQDAQVNVRDLENQLRALKAEGLKLRDRIKSTSTADKCHACGQSIDNSHAHAIVADCTSAITDINNRVKAVEEKLQDTQAVVKHIGGLIAERNKASLALAEYEKYHALYKPYVPLEVLDKVELESKKKELETAKAKYVLEVDKVSKHNNMASSHNARIELLEKQKLEHTQELTEVNLRIEEVTDKLATLQVLVKTFSTTGLVAYKIENLVKDLEDITNEYLTELSDGRFQLTFTIGSSDKLSVVIIDNGSSVDITALSSGERARVNTATLLAIRKLMQSISGSKLNLLILDETIETLDAEGKDKLIEILTNEPNLNTILVSHGYTHPLLEKVYVTKTKNISRLE